MKFFFVLLFSSLLFTACSPSKRAANSFSDPAIKISGLKLLDEYQVAHKMVYQYTQVGGLSGIDYNEKENKYYFISDDRSNNNPARFYTAHIQITNGLIDTVIFISADTLLQTNGKSFPAHKTFPQFSPDPESIRYNPKSNSLIWTSEGERQTKAGTEILQQPFIYEMDLNGHFIDSFFMPANLKMQAGETGPRRNSVFEGVSFTEDYNSLFLSCEEPLLQDGSAAAVDFSGALTRITKFDYKTKKALSQFAYPLDAIAHTPKPANAFAVNGISEILCLDENHLLVMERSFSTGRLLNTIKIYLADISEASNILNKASLTGKRNFKPVAKKLLFNSDSLNRYFDNIEGICFGPNLPNGNRSILIVSDDNFNPLEITQIFLFEVLP